MRSNGEWLTATSRRGAAAPPWAPTPRFDAAVRDAGYEIVIAGGRIQTV
ncbi:hypothetical protein DVA67_024255 [Solirubrobacter sp. CPCC 204708]|nr:hypothetical protein [Solirubrobacter deserti]